MRICKSGLMEGWAEGRVLVSTKEVWICSVSQSASQEQRGRHLPQRHANDEGGCVSCRFYDGLMNVGLASVSLAVIFRLLPMSCLRNICALGGLRERDNTFSFYTYSQHRAAPPTKFT